MCLRLLTDRARSRAELAERLAKKGYSAEVAERVLDRLAEVGLVNDADFAQQWVHSRHTYSGKGKRALALELRRKGIGQDDAAEALAQIDSEDERARATELVAKKLRTVSADDRDRAVRRLVSMLARRGFPQGMAFEVVKEQLDRAGAETDGLFDET
ncbi:recombination regulator RecX [Rhodococcus sp. JS3073]|nr:recombination regulator RecX [Rhodococcus sp. JS3073]